MRTSSLCFLLVDDHALFRTGLAMMLAGAWPDARILQAQDWGQALSMVGAERPDLILLDVHLPDGHGVADLAQLQAAAPGCPVLLMSADVDSAQVQQARETGACGFLPKAASQSDVLASVRAALAGEMAFGAVPYAVLSGAAAQADHAAGHVSEAPPGLTPRQLAILGYLGRATPNKAIARQLGLSESEVRAEVSWMTEWLGARSREEAYSEAVARGLVKP